MLWDFEQKAVSSKPGFVRGVIQRKDKASDPDPGSVCPKNTDICWVYLGIRAQCMMVGICKGLSNCDVLVY